MAATAADKILRDKGYNFGIREDQMKVISSILELKDTFAIFPTGFGKSLTYILPPLILNEIKEGKSVVVLATPEAVLSKQWRSIILDVRQNIGMVAYDEAHCISEWGLDFREDCCKIGLLQSIIEAPVLALSATVTKEIKKDIGNVLGLSSNTVVIATLPDRPNILIDICISTENYEEELQWVQDAVGKYGKVCKKIIIYVNSISACEGIYIWLHSALCKNAYSGHVCLENRLVEMFHASTDVESKGRIIESFCRPGGTVRVLIATVACGMGMDIPDIALCVLWDLPPSMMQMWQEIGRCGRDGRDSLAICYAFPRSISLPCQKCRKSNHRKCSCEAGQYIRELTTTQGCYRTHCLEPFKLENIDSHTISDANKTYVLLVKVLVCVVVTCANVAQIVRGNVHAPVK